VRTVATVSSGALLLVAIGTTAGFAQTADDDGAVVTVNALEQTPSYPVLTRGQVVLVNAQRFVVTAEPLPSAEVAEAPPEPQTRAADIPRAPFDGAIWVAGHWIYGPTGFSWVAGRYVSPTPGHVFVPPRWASLDGQYFFFTGFYVPYGVYVRSHFNRYYYSGRPTKQSRPDSGPYWPIGAPTRANSALTSASARDPYWPIGVRPQR
jgi:hypothetical protein